MRSNNNNEAITHLAMPERQIPVLIDSSSGKSEGFVPSASWSDKLQTRVRRLSPSFVKDLKNPRRRKEIEREHGAINSTEWNQLRALIDLLDRVNAGDLSPIVETNTKDALSRLRARLDELSPGGWLMDKVDPGTRKMSLRSASGGKQLEIDLVKLHRTTREDIPTLHKGKDQEPLPTQGNIETREISISGTCKTPMFALSEVFTAGLSKTRFVVWWSDVGKKLVPGLYCPDIVTALYALAMWSSGTAGGWAVCQRCGKDYPRSRARQLYCKDSCRSAAGMKRLRRNQQMNTASESKTIKSMKREEEK